LPTLLSGHWREPGWWARIALMSRRSQNHTRSAPPDLLQDAAELPENEAANMMVDNDDDDFERDFGLPLRQRGHATTSMTDVAFRMHYQLTRISVANRVWSFEACTISL
jgi:hypothetical protein